MSIFRIVADPKELAHAAANSAIATLRAAIDAYGDATWILAGGSTPLPAYRILAQVAPDVINWSSVRLGIGDERCVPVDHPDSNWGQAAKMLLDHVPILQGNQLRPRGEVSAEKGAAEYEKLLGALPIGAADTPRLDLVWLGVGEDGHTLSLFPGHPQLDITERLVVAVHNSPKPPLDRISLSLEALKGTAYCTILAAGADKAGIIARARAGDDRLPVVRAAATIEKAGGNVTWLLDTAAAGE